MACFNNTYIERLQFEFTKENVSPKLRGKLVFPYKLNSIRENLNSTLGENIFLWFLPVSGFYSLCGSDGVYFKVRSDSYSGGFWPLMEFMENKDLAKDDSKEYIVKGKI